MRQAPYYKVYIGKDANNDISELVESFVYEDAVEEDSLLRITIKSDYALSLTDDPRIKTGAILVFQFGYLSGQISEQHRARITDLKHKYRDRVTMEIIALDIGTVARKVQEQKIWKNKTSSQIAREIAEKYGLISIVDETKKVWDNLPQGNKSDMQFLNYLAQREDGGNYVVYIRNNDLYFVERSTDESSVRTYIYGDGDGTVMYFEPTFKESSQKGDANASIVATFDPYKGEYKAEVIDNTTESNTGTLGSYKKEYKTESISKGGGKYVLVNENALGDKGRKNAGFNIQSVAPSPKSHVTDPTPSKTEAYNLGNSKKKSATLKTLVAKLGVVGNPLLVPNTVITMKGVAKVHSGNWLVQKVTHTIKGEGYVTVADLAKNGTNVGKKKAEDANKTVGAEKQEKTVKVSKVNVNVAKGKIG